jgi:hypothetical protein
MTRRERKREIEAFRRNVGKLPPGAEQPFDLCGLLTKYRLDVTRTIVKRYVVYDLPRSVHDG